MAKDTEKLIRQLSLISFLMAERRPVSALEIKQDVEGYSEMNDDAFARRFYADRAELEALGINLKVEKPPEGYFEAELYTLPPENFYLPPIEFSDGELAALQTSLALLDGRFAYAEPLRLALQQLSWGRPSPLGSRRPAPGVAVAVTASAGGRELSAAAGEGRDRDLAPQDDRVRVLLDRARRAEQAQGRPLPPALPGRPVLPRRARARARRDAGLPPLAHHRQGLLREQGRARLHDARGLRSRGPTRGAPTGSWASRTATAQVWISERIAWLVERDFGQHGDFAPVTQSGNQWRAGSRRVPGPGVVFTTEFAQPRQLVSWVLGLGEHARLLEPVRAGRRGRRAARHDPRAPRGPAPGLRRGAGAPGAAPRTSPSTATRPTRAATATARRRSAPSASRGWSRSPAS